MPDRPYSGVAGWGQRDDGDDPAVCPACRQTVPAAPFCGSCGADAAAPVNALRTILRPNVYATAHRGDGVDPRVSSTLPRVPGRMRRPFRLEDDLVLIVIVALAADAVQADRWSDHRHHRLAAAVLHLRLADRRRPGPAGADSGGRHGARRGAGRGSGGCWRPRGWQPTPTTCRRFRRMLADVLDVDF